MLPMITSQKTGEMIFWTSLHWVIWTTPLPVKVLPTSWCEWMRLLTYYHFKIKGQGRKDKMTKCDVCKGVLTPGEIRHCDYENHRNDPIRYGEQKPKYICFDCEEKKRRENAMP